MSQLIQNNQVIKSVFHYTCVMTNETGLVKSTTIGCKEYEIADKRTHEKDRSQSSILFLLMVCRRA